jgi:tyrosinase
MARGRLAMNDAIKKSPTCTKEKLRIRREWYVYLQFPLFGNINSIPRGDLSAGAKLRYISAVKCLMKKPSKLDPVEYPGAKSRYDDFIVVHMKQTPFIHGTGNFLTWHRYYMATFEDTLRNECHYNGTQPYWNWSKWAQSLETSPLFDGSPTSLGGQGYKTKVNGTAQRPAGEGGGCIASGPFKGLQVNLG